MTNIENMSLPVSQAKGEAIKGKGLGKEIKNGLIFPLPRGASLRRGTKGRVRGENGFISLSPKGLRSEEGRRVGEGVG